MKVSSTIFAILCSSAILFAQGRQGAPGTGENTPVVIRDAGSSEAVAIIQSIRNGITASTRETAPKRGFTEVEYQTLTMRADDFMLQRKYDDAILLYREILKERDDSYAKDRILEAEALRAKQQKETEQFKKDEVLFANAETASSERNWSHSVHFTGALMSDESSARKWTSEAFNRRDPYSDFIQPGKYNIAGNLKNSMGFSLDGIAVPEGTRLIVYEKPDCTGKVLLDVTGPAIVNNGYRMSNRRFKELGSKQFHAALQSSFPQSTRSWSETNMHEWGSGSMEIKMETIE